MNAAGERGMQGDQGPGRSALLSTPKGLFLTGRLLFIADRDNQRVRLLYGDTGTIESAAGPVLVPTATAYPEAPWRAPGEDAAGGGAWR